ncbi:MAG: ribonuclease H-like domain-containing protein [Prevotella sp.]|nr:ribonuclease H-like domain-containing protein [Prevotella sp.]
MKLNLQKPLVIFDLETTGLDLVKDRVIQISYIKVYPDGREVRGNELINPERNIDPGITQLTGISNDDVKDKPTFKQLSQKLCEVFAGSDIAGYNSNHFDVPLLAEEFLRSGIDFDFSKCRLIDVQTIYHKMERRNLAAAYKFYCGRRMEDDFEAHRADQDTEATYRVLQGELDMYTEERQRQLGEDPEGRVLQNDMQMLADFSKMNDNVDFAGRIVWADVNGKRTEVFNFGKHKGVPVADVLRFDPGYYSWILGGDFTYNTKQVLTRIRLREAQR